MQKLAAFQPFVFAWALGLPSALAPASPATDARLADIFQYYQSIKDFRADFQQVKRLALEGLELKSAGTLTVSFGQGLLWDVRTPGRLTVFLSPETLEIRAGEGARQTTNKYDLKSGAHSEKMVESLKELTALLSMNKDEVARQYVSGSEGDVITLTPKAPRQFTRVRLIPAAGEGGAWLDKIEIDEVSGDKLLLDFEKPVKADAGWIAAWRTKP